MVEDRPVEELVRTEIDGAVATVTIDRPEAANSLTGAMRDHLTATFEDLSADLGVRAVVLTGAGARHFCTGAGLGGPAPVTPTRPEGAPDRTLGDVARLVRRGWQRLVTAILDCEKPVVAAVNGTAAGGGANLVLACDLVVMADTARLIELFVRRGIIPDAGGCWLLPRAVGAMRAKELLLLGDDLGAEACLAWGIANRVVPDSAVAAEAGALAARLAEGPSKALTMTKWLVNRSFESSRHTALEEEAYAQELVAATDDMAEGIRAFGERRPPTFRGW